VTFHPCPIGDGHAVYMAADLEGPVEALVDAGYVLGQQDGHYDLGKCWWSWQAMEMMPDRASPSVPLSSSMPASAR
jgi:hypothetical protein